MKNNFETQEYKKEGDNMEKICENCKYLTEVNLYYEDSEGLKPYGKTTFCCYLDDFTKSKDFCNNFERR